MQLNDLPKEALKSWSPIPEGVPYTQKDVAILYVATCLGGETGELLNKVKKMFRMKYYTKAHGEEELEKKVKEEFADVLFYIARLADLMSVDMEKEFTTKMEENIRRYGLKNNKE